MQQLDDEVSATLAKRLAELQGVRSDAAWAEMLGCTREHWVHIRTGKRRVSYQLVRRIGREYPELYTIVMRDLMDAQLSAPAESGA